MVVPVIDDELCSGCGECTEVCPPQCIVLEEDVAVIAHRFCEECGECVDVCPEEAISLPRAKHG